MKNRYTKIELETIITNYLFNGTRYSEHQLIEKIDEIVLMADKILSIKNSEFSKEEIRIAFVTLWHKRKRKLLINLALYTIFSILFGWILITEQKFFYGVIIVLLLGYFSIVYSYFNPQ